MVIEDDVADDPAIMNVSRSNPIPMVIVFTFFTLIMNFYNTIYMSWAFRMATFLSRPSKMVFFGQ